MDCFYKKMILLMPVFEVYSEVTL